MRTRRLEINPSDHQNYYELIEEGKLKEDNQIVFVIESGEGLEKEMIGTIPYQNPFVHQVVISPFLSQTAMERKVF